MTLGCMFTNQGNRKLIMYFVLGCIWCVQNKYYDKILEEQPILICLILYLYIEYLYLFLLTLLEKVGKLNQQIFYPN